MIAADMIARTGPDADKAIIFILPKAFAAPFARHGWRMRNENRAGKALEADHMDF